MQELVIASNNEGKKREINQLLEGVKLLTLKDISFFDEIAEPFQTFEENAFAKASTIYKFCSKNVFADDSGICVNELNGNPGVDSAHFSGSRDDDKNLQKLLNDLEGKASRSAYYKAVICLIWEDETYFFEGICNGNIIDKPRGDGGFGYDPIFVPEGYNETFGELSLEIKNSISHRGKAIRSMMTFLKEKINGVI